MKKLLQSFQLLLNHPLYLFFLILNFIGVILTICYVLARFILHLLPKNIPFDLYLIRFIALLYICLLFTWLIKKILYPKLPSESSQIFLNYIYKLYRPIYILDETLRSNKAFKSFILLISKILPYITPTFGGLFVHLIVIFVPRLFLLILLIVDVFYYNCIELFYTYAYVGLIPLVVKYYIYVIKSLKEEYIEYLDELYCVDAYEETMSIRKFIEDKAYCYIRIEAFNETMDMTRCICGFQLALYDKHNKKYVWDVTEEESIAWKKDFYYMISIVVDIDRFLDSHDFIVDRYTNKMSKHRGKRLYIIWVSVVVYSGYLICWVYVLLVSLPTFHLLNFEMVFLESFQDIMSPFTNDVL